VGLVREIAELGEPVPAAGWAGLAMAAGWEPNSTNAT